MSALKGRVRRLTRSVAADPDAWLKSLSTEELLFLVHHDGQAILSDPTLAAEERDQVAEDLAALQPPPVMDEQRRAALIARAVAQGLVPSGRRYPRGRLR